MFWQIGDATGLHSLSPTQKASPTTQPASNAGCAHTAGREALRNMLDGDCSARPLRFVSNTFVGLAQQLAERAGVAVDFRQGDVVAMPFDDGRFDLIICQAAFKNFTNH